MTTTTTTAPPPSPDATPALRELAKLRRWVGWKWALRDGKLTKPPYQANGELADSTDPDTWATYKVVAEAVAASGRDGSSTVEAIRRHRPGWLS
jgi:hypothetical protein